MNELQKRRVIAEAAEAPRPPARQDGRAARPGVQAEHGRHARGAVARARVAPARRGRRGTRLGSDRARRRSRACSSATTPLEAVQGADAAVIVTEWPRARRARDRRDARGDAPPADHRRSQPARSRRRARAPASPTRGSAAPSRRSTSFPRRPSASRNGVVSGGADPRRRQGRASRRRRARSSEAARSRRGPPARGVPGRPTCRGGRHARDRRVRSGLRVAVRGGARRARAGDRRGRRAGAARPRRRASPRRVAPARERAGLRAERRRAARGRPRATCWKRHRSRGAAATIVVSQVRSPFGVVDVDDNDTIAGFREAPMLPQWVSSGVYVLDDECVARLPERGDHEDDDVPRARRGGQARRVPQHELLAHRQHAEAAPRGRAVHAGAPRARGGARVSLDSPNLLDLDALGDRGAARRQAVGLGARLGRDGPSTSARCCSSAPASR